LRGHDGGESTELLNEKFVEPRFIEEVLREIK
jgi:hypothetical protein